MYLYVEIARYTVFSEYESVQNLVDSGHSRGNPLVAPVPVVQ
jgi:hypothetical protein